MSSDIESLRQTVAVLRRDLDHITADMSSIERRLETLATDIGDMRPMLSSLVDMTREYVERRAVNRWLGLRFSSLKAIGVAVAAIAVLIGAVNALAQWALLHYTR